MISRRSAILGILGRGAGADQVLAPLRDLGFGLDEIERRNLSGIDANLVLPRELLRELERSLLNGDVRQRRLERPVRLLDRGHRLNDGLAEAKLGALLVSLRDDVLLPRGVDLAIPEQRLRERELDARLQARIEAADRIVGRRPRRVPRHAPRAGAPRQPLPDAGRREPVVDVHAAVAQQEVRGRRHVARAAERRREHRRIDAAALAHARRLDLGAEPDDREIGIVLDRAPNRVVERELTASRLPVCADAVVAEERAVDWRRYVCDTRCIRRCSPIAA